MAVEIVGNKSALGRNPLKKSNTEQFAKINALTQRIFADYPNANPQQKKDLDKRLQKLQKRAIVLIKDELSPNDNKDKKVKDLFETYLTNARKVNQNPSSDFTKNPLQNSKESLLKFTENRQETHALLNSFFDFNEKLEKSFLRGKSSLDSEINPEDMKIIAKQYEEIFPSLLSQLLDFINDCLDKIFLKVKPEEREAFLEQKKEFLEKFTYYQRYYEALTNYYQSLLNGKEVDVTVNGIIRPVMTAAELYSNWGIIRNRFGSYMSQAQQQNIEDLHKSLIAAETSYNNLISLTRPKKVSVSANKASENTEAYREFLANKDRYIKVRVNINSKILYLQTLSGLLSDRKRADQKIDDVKAEYINCVNDCRKLMQEQAILTKYFQSLSLQENQFLDQPIGTDKRSEKDKVAYFRKTLSSGKDQIPVEWNRAKKSFSENFAKLCDLEKNKERASIQKELTGLTSIIEDLESKLREFRDELQEVTTKIEGSGNTHRQPKFMSKMNFSSSMTVASMQYAAHRGRAIAKDLENREVLREDDRNKLRSKQSGLEQTIADLDTDLNKFRASQQSLQSKIRLIEEKYAKIKRDIENV